MRKVKVLIVEDEIVIVRGLEDALKNLGFAVCGFATSGEDAVRQLERKKPDLVLVDIYLDGTMDGIELAQIITSRYRLPIIYLTANSNKEILERAKHTHPLGYIVKPFRESQLKVTIELALERCKVERERMARLEEYLKTIDELQGQLFDRALQLDGTKSELEVARKELDKLRQELQGVDGALLTLTNYATRTREEMEMEVAAALRVKILPILNHLQQDPAFQKYRIELEMLSMHMSQFSPNLMKCSYGTDSLSIMELRVAALIKNGLSSQQIADQLHLSWDTIKTHRRNIRKKLGIQNTHTNLATYLISHWG
jgi:DNA-binding NarL/FixJ family response regulator